ncbi:DUF977 family protein [Lelliottia sp. WB101]
MSEPRRIPTSEVIGIFGMLRGPGEKCIRTVIQRGQFICQGRYDVFLD